MSKHIMPEYREGVATRQPMPFQARVIDAERRLVEFVGSDESIDRFQTKLKNWVTTNYERNPVILWAHRQDVPAIGRAVSVKRDKNKQLRFVVEFTPADLNDFGHRMFRMVQEGFLRAVSVGFIPGKIEYREPTAETKGFYELMDNELLELSLVNVPANPNALASARGMGLIGDDEMDLFVANRTSLPALIGGKPVDELRQAVADWACSVSTDGDAAAPEQGEVPSDEASEEGTSRSATPFDFFVEVMRDLLLDSGDDDPAQKCAIHEDVAEAYRERGKQPPVLVDPDGSALTIDAFHERMAACDVFTFEGQTLTCLKGQDEQARAYCFNGELVRVLDPVSKDYIAEIRAAIDPVNADPDVSVRALATRTSDIIGEICADLNVLDPLTLPERVRAMYVELETLRGELAHERVGKVLNRRNTQRLTSAQQMIQEVLNEAGADSKPEEEEKSAPTEDTISRLAEAVEERLTDRARASAFRQLLDVDKSPRPRAGDIDRLAQLLETKTAGLARK